MNKLEPVTEPPEGLGPDDLAKTLLYHMGVGWTAQNSVAAAEALRIKGNQSKWTIARAYVHIYQRWMEYKGSDSYRSSFKKKAASWLTEGDYDNPESWGGTRKATPCVDSTDAKDIIAEMRELKKDRELHPEKYMSISDLAGVMEEIAKKKAMPRIKIQDIRPFQINPERNKAKLEAQAEMLRQEAERKAQVGSQHSLSEE